jgi:hypothetical protein
MNTKKFIKEFEARSGRKMYGEEDAILAKLLHQYDVLGKFEHPDSPWKQRDGSVCGQVVEDSDINI